MKHKKQAPYMTYIKLKQCNLPTQIMHLDQWRLLNSYYLKIITSNTNMLLLKILR